MATLAQRRAAARARLSRSRGGRAFLGLGGRTGQLAMGGGIGGAAQYLGEFVANKVDFVKNHWYGEPAMLGVGAFLAIRRKPTWAYALAGAAGYSAAFRYKLNQFQQGKGATPVPTFATTTSTGLLQNNETAAYDNAVGF